MKTVLSLLRRQYCVVLALSILLPGCAVQQHQLSALAQTLDQGRASQVLERVREEQFPQRDFAQYKLTLGLLLALNGDFNAAITELQAAKAEIERLQALSISENLAAVTINETLRSYTSSSSEQMLLQQLLMLSYLLEQDLDGARVEVLQMQELAKTLPDEGLSGVVASSYYLAGVVYELSGEDDNAMISYRQAYQAMQANQLAVPKALQQSLLYFSRRLGLTDEHHQYVQTFGYALPVNTTMQSKLVVLYWGGTVSPKQQRFMSVYEPSLGYNISLALPYYNTQYPRSQPWHFNVAGKSLSTEPLDDVNQLARADLAADSAAIYAAALARVIVKQTLLNEVQKNDQDGFVTLLANISSMVSESADIRSWNMLPATIQVQREGLVPGNYYLQQPKAGQGLSLSQHDAGNNSPALALTPGSTLLLFYSSAAPRSYYYLSR